ncbi:MAG TPA: two-component regulator propeller domain-containing protein [Bacteroidota bacterium]|nr:two-component regulator propeller domain-containing protein [Bacteroidota bacterium]
MRRGAIFLPALLCVLYVHIVQAQHYPFVRYGAMQGLPDEHVTAITQDHRGFLWIGTARQGVLRFDGQRFVPLTLALDDTVHSIATDGRGVLYVGTRDGLRCVRLRANCSDTRDTILERRLAGIRGPVREMYLLNAQELYIATARQSWLLRLRDSTARRIATRPVRHDHLRALFPGERLLASARDCRGRDWLVTAEALLCRADEGTLRFDRGNGLRATAPRAVFCDDEGSVWLGASDGLWQYVPDRFHHYLPGDELPAARATVSCVLHDDDRALWVGTLGAGIRVLHGEGPRDITRRNGLPSDTVRALLALPSGDVLIGTEGGLSVWSRGRVRDLREDFPLPAPRVRCLYRSSDGAYWVGTTEGLLRRDADGAVLYTTRDDLPSNRITALAEDEAGFLWVGTDRGAARISLSTASVYPPAGLRGKHILSIFRDSKGMMWFGTVGSGVFLGSSGTSSIGTEKGLAGNTVTCITEDDYGSLYFGSNAGISVLPYRDVNLLANGDEPAVSGIDPAVIMELLQRQAMFTLDTRNGLGANEVSTVHCGPGGELYFGSGGIVNCYQPTPPPRRGRWISAGCAEKDGAAPSQRMFISSLRVDEEERTERGAVRMRAGERMLRVQLLAPTFRNAASRRFLYQLEGHEYRWHESMDGSIEYAGLPPGEYTLMLRLHLGEGRWTPRHAMLRVVVDAPFVETLWFQVTLLLAAGLAVVVVVLRARRHARRTQVSRLRLAETLLSEQRVSGQGSLASTTSAPAEPATTSAEADGQLSLLRERLLQHSDVLWLLDATNDTLTAVLHALREHAAALPCPVRIEHRIPARVLRRAIAPARRMALLRLLLALLDGLIRSEQTDCGIDVTFTHKRRRLVIQLHRTSAQACDGSVADFARAREIATAQDWDLHIGADERGMHCTLHILATALQDEA